VESLEFDCPGVVLSAIGANCGRCFLAEGQWTTLANVQAILPKSTELDHRFLFYRVDREDYWTRSGSAQPFIKPSDIGTSWLAAPLVAEQARIADVLDTLDEAIRGAEEILRKTEATKEGLLQSLFAPRSSTGKHLGSTKLGSLPEEWEVVPLRECVRPDTMITYGIVQAGPHIDDGIPYIRTGDMSGDALSVEGLLRTSPRIDRAYARSKVRTGEIVCAIRATVGKVLPVPPTLDGANLTQGTARIAPSSDINSSYLLWALRSPRVQREFGLAVKGTTFAEITLEALREIPVPRPRAREEQDVIAATLDGVEMQIRSERAQLSKLLALKAGLSSDLLTGRIRVATGAPA
jgi:type I restriction enzyme, S subunit